MSVKDEILRTYAALFEPSTVVELRAFKGNITYSGYFDNPQTLAGEATKLDDQGFQVYVTLNPVLPDLLAKSFNRVRRIYQESLTGDKHILHRRWLPLDFDPQRPADISSTDEEKKAALYRCQEARDYLDSLGWPTPIFADSGNGYHLLYRIDLPNGEASRALVRSTLEALAYKFNDDQVKLDTSTFNAARIWKLYGCVARKGDDVSFRPHRPSKLLWVPENEEAAA